MLNWLARLFFRLQVAVFRRSNGKRMAFMRGMPILLLTTIGRKSGKTRTTPLMYLRDGEQYVVIASNSGRDRHPAWYHNLRATGQATIDVPGRQLAVTASEVTGADQERLWAQLVARAPFFDGYRGATDRQIPLMLLRQNATD